MDTTTPIQRAANACGGIARLAEKVNRAYAYVWQMTHGVRPVPPQLVLTIERATNGAVTRYELRPDIFDAPPESGGKQAA